jgi:hypothetical protein
MENEDLSIFDYVFCGLGNTNLILSIIKLIEDKMNLEHDIQEAGVQMILLVEDSIRFYSSILPNLYNYILEQSKNFSKEALNRHAATMRMRGRPKVVLARTYEEAQKLYDKYSNNTLGVISDARFPLKSAAKAFGNKVETEAKPKHRTDTFGREKCPDAGLQLFRYIRKNDPFVPLILESSESDNRAKAEAEGFRFVDKNSKKMSVDLRRLMEEHMGFGEADQKAGDYAEDLAAMMLSTTLGIEFDNNTTWNQKEEIWKMSGKIVKTTNITQSAICVDGVWTTVVAAAVFVR